MSTLDKNEPSKKEEVKRICAYCKEPIIDGECGCAGYGSGNTKELTFVGLKKPKELNKNDAMFGGTSED